MFCTLYKAHIFGCYGCDSWNSSYSCHKKLQFYQRMQQMCEYLLQLLKEISFADVVEAPLWHMFTQHHLQLHNDRLELLQQNVTAKYWQLDIAVTLQLLLDQLLLGSKSRFMFLECVVRQSIKVLAPTCQPRWLRRNQIFLFGKITFLFWKFSFWWNGWNLMFELKYKEFSAASLCVTGLV